MPRSGRISIRTRRRTATDASAAPPAVEYGVGPGGAPRPSARRAKIPPLAVVTAPTPAASPAATLPIPSGRDRTEPVGTPLLRLAPPPNFASAATADLDALGASAELQFGDSAARYSHADWARELQAGPACHAAIRYIVLGRPPPLPFRLLSCFPSHKRSCFSEIQELAGKAGYTPPTTASSCSSANRLCNPRLTRSTQWDARLVCWTMSLFAFMYRCS